MEYVYMYNVHVPAMMYDGTCIYIYIYSNGVRVHIQCTSAMMYDGTCIYIYIYTCSIIHHGRYMYNVHVPAMMYDGTCIYIYIYSNGVRVHIQCTSAMMYDGTCI